MKKFIISLIVFSVMGLSAVPSQAVEQKSLVIIDSYFDSRVSVSETVCVSTIGCSATVTRVSRSLSDNVNHGNAMVEVAKRQDAGVSIIAIQAGNAAGVNVGDVNAADFIRALSWVSSNSSKVGAVSISRFFNGPGECSPSHVGTNAEDIGGVSAADLRIRGLISSLKEQGIPVFASTGNIRGRSSSYPACITDTNSVSVGAQNRSGATVSSFSFDGNTDFFASANLRSYQSSIFGLIANTTSAGTAAVAATYMLGKLDKKFVDVLR